ncbi:MAG: hypothetical protein NUW01_11675 [Gemmatimonadaceae bacterium]|nr:hypothetical protein [Gemmatimonadaceae bacterium]
MRIRTGSNPYHEAHGKPLRVYEFIADGTRDASAICDAAEAATGLRLRVDPAGQDGYVNTSLRPDGSRFVVIVLYEACADTDCPTGHRTLLRRAPDIDVAKQAALKIAVGEHARHRLTGTPADAATLRALGFKDNDPPLRGG